MTDDEEDKAHKRKVRELVMLFYSALEEHSFEGAVFIDAVAEISARVIVSFPGSERMRLMLFMDFVSMLASAVAIEMEKNEPSAGPGKLQ